MDDANEVVEIFKYTLSSVPPITPPQMRTRTETGKITGNKVTAFINFLRQQSEESNGKLFTRDDLESIADSGGIVIKNFSSFIFKLNEEGILLKKGNDLYQFINK